MKSDQVTEFEKKVYRAIAGIPIGETRSYQWVAKKIGKPRAARAVGNALNKNPFAPAIPCHRVVKSSGDLGGFRSGAEKKSRLLAWEKNIKKILF